ncbi:hypothetical protein LQF61_08610 [Tetragenococcus koreensis]|uniref:Zn-finger containing protein n=1 Tax=Tetragenococcus koreensis TaxID=290335 RepID=A0AAN4UDR2_9ENTE|nr:hypothetical protein [Tetragenococcus koreensis]AYW45711.1 hypothetical protein C7K43_06985 [Tetragenococcus koreensis]MCF1585544.1 hypothetical protein [Tetragenococcus koreensis]MCF1615090.1 hypothetical protein [Tetragenococcus koreensis]MCF1620135.1 hypothetical protein [Tetragenococcus koreensis]MCF1624918.1 hypothetical protein [Tetragenococcus koreensis]
MQSNWQNKIIQFMRGRYGVFDPLNKMLLILTAVLFILNVFSSTLLLRILPLVLLVIVYYRFFSKRIYVRSNENQKYLRWQNKIKNFFKLKKEAFQNRKSYVYFHCPECKKALRAPKGKGKLKITCSQCHHQFIKKV